MNVNQSSLKFKSITQLLCDLAVREDNCSGGSMMGGNPKYFLFMMSHDDIDVNVVSDIETTFSI